MIGGKGNTRLNPKDSNRPLYKGFHQRTIGKGQEVTQANKFTSWNKDGAMNAESASKKEFLASQDINKEKLLSSHLDYLRFRFKLTPRKFKGLLEYLDNEQIVIQMDYPWTAGHGATWYENKIVSNLGIVGGFTFDEVDNIYEGMMDFSGQYFSGKTVVDQWRLLTGLQHTFKVICSRIDLAIDDDTYSIIPVMEMRKGWEKRENFGFKNHKMVESGATASELVKTYYYGSRNSGKMVRVYNHENECQRFEAEFKRTYAPFVFKCIASMQRDWFNGEKDYMSAMEDIEKIKLSKEVKFWLKEAFDKLHGCNEEFEITLQKIIGIIAVSAIDFRDRSSRKDRSKASRKDTKRCSYYQEFIEKVGGQIKIRTPKVISTIEKSIAWMVRQVSKTFSIVRDSLGSIEFREWQEQFTRIGQSKQKLIDAKLVEYIKKNPRLVAIS